MRKLILSIPGLHIAYIIARALLAVVGIVAIGEYVFNGIEGTRLAIHYVLLCAWGVLIAITIKYTIQSRIASRTAGNSARFEIKPGGRVHYYDDPPEIDFKSLSEGRISALLAQYPPNKYKGTKWNKFRTDLLTAQKPYKAGDVVNF